MFDYKSVKQESVAQRRLNEELSAQTAKNKADVEFIAMMTDVDLDTGADMMGGMTDGN